MSHLNSQKRDFSLYEVNPFFKVLIGGFFVFGLYVVYIALSLNTPDSQNLCVSNLVVQPFILYSGFLVIIISSFLIAPLSYKDLVWNGTAKLLKAFVAFVPVLIGFGAIQLIAGDTYLETHICTYIHNSNPVFQFLFGIVIILIFTKIGELILKKRSTLRY